MRTYVIDELEKENLDKIMVKLDEMELSGGMEGVWFLPLPDELLDEEQAEHKDECGPYIMALEVVDDSLRLELLVRARSRLHCSCIKYAHTAQRGHVMEWLDNLIKDLDIAV